MDDIIYVHIMNETACDSHHCVHFLPVAPNVHGVLFY